MSYLSQLTDRHRWLPFVLPYVVYSLLGMAEPSAPEQPADGAAEIEASSNLETVAEAPESHRLYPIYYATRIGLTVIAVCLFLPTYRAFPFQVNPMAILVGVVGVVAWIGLCRLNLELVLLRPLGWDGLLAAGARPSFDPFTAFGESPLRLAAFLAVRFFGLACVVAFVEEWFLRGFVLRFFDSPDWWTIPIGATTPAMVAIGTLYGIVSHPAEALAAAVWFSLVSWLVWKTKNIWDGVAAHMVTNLLLGIYIVVTQDWSLW
jgi:CAAX prenyl protease-like protein